MIDENTTVEQEKLHGIFIGTVLQHLAHGKLKVFIHGIHPDEFKNKPDLLPTCLQMVPQFGGSHDGNGLFSYPNIGATVLCTFANGDQNIPIMLGAIQGGENAFGQYELVKKPDEISSERHLITSGKSHIEMYENGKISAIVFDPIRTEAKVKYNDSIDGQVSVDAVESRPICEKVDANEISNINCQFVLDNYTANGTISSSTYWFNPLNESNTISIDDGKTLVISSLHGEEMNEYANVVGNDGMADSKQIHSYDAKLMSNKNNPSTGLIEQFIQPLTSHVSVIHHFGIDGSEYTDIISNNVDSSNYSQKNLDGNIISTLNSKTEYSSYINHSVPLDFSIGGTSDIKSISQYSNTAIGANRTQNLKSNASNSFYATKDLEITIESLSTGKLTEVDSLLQLNPHINKHNALARLELKAENGFNAYSIYDDNDLKVIGKTTTQVIKNNTSTIEAATNENVYLKLYSHEKLQKTIDGSTQKNDVECINYMIPTDGKIKIQIVDNIKKNSCSMVFGSDGVLNITASNKIMIDAPEINISGQTMTQSFKTMTLKAQTMNITGSSGDCKIKNVSLLNHKHQETQSGDVVSPQPTQTAAASN